MADLTVYFRGKEYQVVTRIPQNGEDPDDFYEIQGNNPEILGWNWLDWGNFAQSVQNELSEHEALSFGGD